MDPLSLTNNLENNTPEISSSVQDAPIVPDTPDVLDAPIVPDTPDMQDVPNVPDTTGVQDAGGLGWERDDLEEHGRRMRGHFYP